jgi:flavin-binding protein dodecin
MARHRASSALPSRPGPPTLALGRIAMRSNNLLDQPQCPVPVTTKSREVAMAKNKENGVYRIVDVVGVSTVSWEDAAKRAVETAAKSIRDLRIAEVTKMDITVKNGKVSAFRTRVALSFKYEK